VDAVDFCFESKLFAGQLSSSLVVCEVLILVIPVPMRVCAPAGSGVGSELHVHMEGCLPCWAFLLSVCCVL